MDPKTQAAVSFLRDNLHRRLTLREIAQSVDLSCSRLSFLLKTQLGMTPIVYIKKARLEMARGLLELSLKSVKAIAFEVGYSDPTRFMRDFKKAYGKTPSQYGKELAESLATRKAGAQTNKQEDSLVNRRIR